MPKISVIMSVYNGERYLPEAVESILGQTFTDIEFIIIDDGSTDKSPEIIKDYAAGDKRIKVITNDFNMGLTRSLNRAITEAGGDYVARMDADDISLPGRLGKQHAYLQEHSGVGVVGCNVKMIDDDGEAVKDVMMPADMNSFIRQRNCLVHGSVLIRRDVIQRVGGYDEGMRYAQDYEMWLRVSKAYRFGYVDEFLYKWRVHKGAIYYKRFFSQIFYTAMAKTKVLHNSGTNSPRFLYELIFSFFYIYKAGIPLLMRRLSIIK